MYGHCFCAVITYELNKANLDKFEFETGNDDVENQETQFALSNLNQDELKNTEITKV